MNNSTTVQDLGYQIDWVCWAYCIFSSPADFKSLHDAAGEACDYAVMKAEVLTDLAGAHFNGQISTSLGSNGQISIYPVSSIGLIGAHDSILEANRF